MVGWWVFGVLLAAGCGGNGDGGGEDPMDEAPVVVAEGNGVVEEVAARPIDPKTVGSVRGVVVFEGEVPRPKIIDPTTVLACDHGKPEPSDKLIIHDRRVENVMVYVRRGLKGWEMPPFEGEPVVLDQLGCQYRPHVVVVRVGQKLLVRNSDPTTHNVNARSRRNESFNKLQPKNRPDIEVDLERSEVGIPVGCDLHPWMGAVIHSLDHPFSALSAADGTFQIVGLPPGDYSLRAVHETLGHREAQVTVPASGAARVTFTFTSD